MKINRFFYPFLFISSVFCAENINTTAITTIESLQGDEVFFYMQVFKFLGIRDQSIACRVSKSFRRILKKGIIPQVIKELTYFSELTGISDECIDEFEIIWKISHFLDENRWIKDQKDLISKGLEINSNLNLEYRPIDISVVFIIIYSFRKLNFPVLISEFLKGFTDERIKKKLISIILLRSEIYKDALRILAKDIYKCKRDRLIYRIYDDGDAEKSELKILNGYNSRVKNEIIYRHHGIAAMHIFNLSLITLIIISTFWNNEAILRTVTAVFFILAVRIIYKLNANWWNEYESFT